MSQLFKATTTQSKSQVNTRTTLQQPVSGVPSFKSADHPTPVRDEKILISAPTPVCAGASTPARACTPISVGVSTASAHGTSQQADPHAWYYDCLRLSAQASYNTLREYDDHNPWFQM